MELTIQQVVDAASVVLDTCTCAHTSPQLSQQETNMGLKLLTT